MPSIQYMQLFEDDPMWAMKVAEQYLKQHNSDLLPVEAYMEGSVWVVTMSIGLTDKRFRKVVIDANSGKILSCS